VGLGEFAQAPCRADFARHFARVVDACGLTRGHARRSGPALRLNVAPETTERASVCVWRPVTVVPGVSLKARRMP
jgi:hypothetical protein